MSRREALDRLGLRLCGRHAMLQAALGDGLTSDPFAFEEDALATAKIEFDGPKFVEAVESGAAIALGEGGDLPFEISGRQQVSSRMGFSRF